MRLQLVLLFALLAQAFAAGDSCLGRCEDYDRIKDHCQCDMDCEKYKNCCPDYEALCNMTTHRDTFAFAEDDHGELEGTTPSPEQSFTGIIRRLRPTPISDFGRRPQSHPDTTLEMVRPPRLVNAGDSCLGRCEDYDRIKDHCQCDMDCEKYKNCCPDYEALCNMATHRDAFAFAEDDHGELEGTTPSPEQSFTGIIRRLRPTPISDFGRRPQPHPDITLEMVRPPRLVNAGDSCLGRCEDYDRIKDHCQCDMDCEKYKNCCPDYEALCNMTTHRDTFAFAEDDHGELEGTTPSPEQSFTGISRRLRPTPISDFGRRPQPHPDTTLEMVRPPRLMDAENSCSDRCEDYDRYKYKCQCDMACKKYKNCCPDYETICNKTTHRDTFAEDDHRELEGTTPSPEQSSRLVNAGDSCLGRCEDYDRIKDHCQCDMDCEKYKNCCPDYEALCSMTTHRDTFAFAKNDPRELEGTTPSPEQSFTGIIRRLRPTPISDFGRRPQPHPDTTLEMVRPPRLVNAGDSCLGRCEDYDRIKDHCQCDMDCEKYKNCCPDYEALCSMTTHRDTFAFAEDDHGELEGTTPSPEQPFTGIIRRLRPTPISDFGRRPQSHPDTTLEMVRPPRLVNAGDSCLGRCEDYDRIKDHCQCDMDCEKYKNCCPDYEALCSMTTHRDTFAFAEDDHGELEGTTPSPEQSFTGINRRLRPTPISDFGRRPQPHPDTTLEMVRPPRLMDAIYQKTSIPQMAPSTTEATTVNGTTAATTETPNPDAVACSGRPFDSFLQQKNGSIYAFRGEYFFELDQKSVLPGYPKLIKDVWGISGPIDAAFTRINCQGKTYIFKGSKYWRFDNGVLDEDFPRDITVGFDRIPDNVDAAFALPAPGHNGREKVYFFKGDQYHMYEFLHQPSHEECVTMSESSPSTLFRRYTDVYDYYERALTDLFSSLPEHHDKHHFIDKDWRGLKAPVDAAMAGRIYIPMQRSNDDQQWYQQYGRQWGRRRQSRSPIWESMAERGMNIGQSFAERGMEMGLRLAERRMEMEERLRRDQDQDWDQDRRRDRYSQNNRGNYDSRDDRSYWEPIQGSLPIQSVYFFKGETYSRVDLRTKRVAFASPPYPRSIAKYWLGCSDTAGAEK